MKSFFLAVREKLGHYVYLYIDPRTDEIFYVGKGFKNRVFHLGGDYGESAVTARIAEIREDNCELKIDILAHGFPDEETALCVEAAAIDLVGRNQLLNKRGGWMSREFGRYSLDEIVALYSQNPIKIRAQDKVLLIRINQLYYGGMPAQELYEVTRGVWKLTKERRNARKMSNSRLPCSTTSCARFTRLNIRPLAKVAHKLHLSFSESLSDRRIPHHPRFRLGILRSLKLSLNDKTFVSRTVQTYGRGLLVCSGQNCLLHSRARRR